MDTLICGTTAYRYWRCPPIVLYLAAAPDDSPALRRFVRPEELLAFRSDLANRLPFFRECQGVSWRNPGQAAKAIRDACWLLAPSCEFPIDVLTQDRHCRRASGLINPMLWTGDLPSRSTHEIADDLGVVGPELALLQIAAHSTLERTVLLASELCGKFAVYPAPPPIATMLQRIANAGKLRSFGGWQPCLSPDGRVTDLWSRDPLTTPGDLLRVADEAAGRPGSAILRQAAGLVVPEAASPFEVQAGVMLGFSRRRGGEGYEGLTHNEKVELNQDGRLIADRECCYCDLYWQSGLDVECQSSQYHDNIESLLSDSDRTAALSLVGVNVLPLTYDNLSNEKNFAAFSSAVARALGIKERQKTPLQRKASRRLRSEIFVPWGTLPDTNSAECAP